MPVYISMLRGINVGANKRMKMEKLRASCEALGFEEVRTYIQSGNLIFKAAKASPAALSKRIEECIVSNFGFSVAVISRSREEMNRIIQGNPLLKNCRSLLCPRIGRARWAEKSISTFPTESLVAVCGNTLWTACCRFPAP